MWYALNQGRLYICWKADGKQHRQAFSRWTWEQANGRIPSGHEIHHQDGDPLNNAIGNLLCVSAEWHDAHHARLREAHIWIDGAEHRKCQRCTAWKPLADFYPRAAGTYHGYCKPCVAAAGREWFAANREYRRAYRRAWYADNPEPVRAARRQYYATNRERINAAARARRLAAKSAK